ncbi:MULTISPECIES: hypothetical protein [Streptosporangium]|uniref:Uncharacterized protein n=1 Tax=Streptosporangium brasiliense TaxID=47480 RepID=A0ABT9QXB5_9ACTN|nr:hypothetical protein [Streptosporangium brasiliense]MDP9861638.1 hypothetical protein [Streptosporangium brasiliense]
MRLITSLFVATGTVLIAWGLYNGIFVVQIWADSGAGEAQIAVALHALARPFLLALSGTGLMLGGIAVAALARAR